MQHLKVKKFLTESKKIRLVDDDLVEGMNQFLLLDDDGQSRCSLGGGLYKIRIATNEGFGKRSGGRSIFAFKNGTRFVWLHLFQKNEKDNITTVELSKLKILAKILLNLSKVDMSRLIEKGELYEVNSHD